MSEIRNVDDIQGYDEYQKDIERLVREECRSSLGSLLESLLERADPESSFGLYMDWEQTKSGFPIRFHFACAFEDDELKVRYCGNDYDS